MMNNTLQEQTNSLISIFQKPVTINLHKNKDNNIKECCQVALCHFNSLLSNQHGLFGALTSLAGKFKWGFSRCEHVCECVSNADNLDCGSGMSLALKLLKPIRGNYLLASVELIITHSKFNTTIWKHRIAEENPNMTPEELALKTIWIEDDCHYHTCIGLISDNNTDSNDNHNINELQLKVWDFGLWILPSYSPHSLTAKLAIRVKIDRENSEFNQSSSSSSSAPLTFQWGKHSIVEDTWTHLFDLDDLRTSPNTVTDNNTTPTSTLCTPPQVFISGCHVSGSPCPGVGLARSIRVIYPEARLTGVDTAEDLATGVSDPIFNARLSLPGVMAPSFSGTYSDWQVLQWDLVYDLLTSDPRAIYLPSRDSDIDIISSSLDKFLKDHEPPTIRKNLPKGTVLYDQDLYDRILSPSLDALDAMAKPSIYGACNSNPTASSRGCYALRFQIPEYLDLSNGDISLYELQDWCNQIGYPIIVKGGRQGAGVCSNWFQITEALKSPWAKEGYVQKFVVGFSMGLCFAAYKGELLGAVLMQKNVVTCEGKAWGGELRSVPQNMLNDLRLFCKSTNFTGGSELEYVEDINGTNWAIDWNPRFPAYIYACTLAGINLPALLVAYCLQDLEKRNTYNLFRKSNLSPKEQDLLRSSRFLTLPRGCEINFSRMVVETIDIYGSSNRTGGGGTMIFSSYSGKSRHHEYKTDDKQSQRRKRLQNLPASIQSDTSSSTSSSNNDNNNNTNNDNNNSTNLVVKTLETDLSFFMNHTPQNETKTPYYVLSTSAASFSLKTQKDTLENVLNNWKKIYSTNNTDVSTSSSNFDSNIISNLIIQPFLSVKTQPHQSLLQTARECGFFAECITIAEIRAALAAGFKDEQIILTGPGKFWFGPDTYEMPKQLHLRAIFADSLEDLKHIINLITEPNSWLQTKTIGVRLSLGGKSRFGIDSNDPQTILDTAFCLKCLPNHIKIGFHFHHASSNLGPSAWWCGLESFLSLTSSIASVSGKIVNILDFGGGWQPHFLNFKETESNMINLFNKMLKFHPHVEAIQFEPGKSVSERSGALICRVLEIRELTRPEDAKYPLPVLSEEDIVSDDNQSVSSKFDRRACIVDACIAELSVNSLHVHPLFWKSKNSTNNEAWSKLDHDGITKGADALWGRSCMEFDILSSNIILPDDIQVGDYVMIAFCGAYDNVMQYDFADGLGRDLQVIG